MELEGEVQNIRTDRKGIALNGEWFSSNFKPISDDINKGDFVKIVYNVKAGFKNIKSIQVITKAKPVIQEKSNNELTSTDKNCILMTSKDLAIAFKDVSLKDWIIRVKQLRENI